ncbi:MAG: vWA domain-containing protein [Alphaproteobacteria bacterium]
MDDKKLQDILKNQPVPSADDNAKKRAVNLAMAAFEEDQKKNKKNSQGFSLLRSLIGITNTKTRNETMEEKLKRKSYKKLLAGSAMLTAGVCLFVIPVAMEGMYETIGEGAGASVKTSSNDSGNQNFGSIAIQVASKEDARLGDDVSPAYVEAIEQQNETNFASVQRSRPAPAKQDGRLNKPTEMRENIAQVPQRQEVDAVSSVAQTKNRAIADEEVSMELADAAVPESFNAPIPASPSLEKFAEVKAKKPQETLTRWRKLSEPVGKAERAKVAKSIAPIVADDIIAPSGYKDVGRDKFEDFKENPFKLVAEEPVSTFSSDVDTASYSFMRKTLNNGVLPQKDAVRVEELINYFDYDYAVPDDKSQPFRPTVNIVDSPWAKGKKLMHVGIKGYEITGEKPRSNLVFLLDVSGSMNSHDKLPLLKNSLKLLLDTLGPDDTVAIAVYAGAAGTVLEPTSVREKHKIISALDRLSAGGSTAGAAGIRLAYELAQENFDDEAINRVILATDGDFNVGITSQEELKDFVERKRESGVFLSVFGFGQGNYNDHMMQTLAQNGNGVAAYIDNLNEARKVLVQEATSSLFPIAKDVKFQIEFNPAAVAEYRLIGYETRSLKREDFNNDKVDAGDIGAGHTVTAIYEFTPKGGQTSVDPLRYGDKTLLEERPAGPSEEYAYLKIRYKLPKESKSKLITTPVTISNALGSYDCPPHAACLAPPMNTDTDFATAVAAFGQILKGGTYTGSYSYDDVIAMAQQGKGADEFGYRSEFIQLVRLAKSARAQ